MLTDDCPYSSFTDPDIASLMRNEGVPWRKGELTGKKFDPFRGERPLFVCPVSHHTGFASPCTNMELLFRQGCKNRTH